MKPIEKEEKATWLKDNGYKFTYGKFMFVLKLGNQELNVAHLTLSDLKDLLFED